SRPTNMMAEAKSGLSGTPSREAQRVVRRFSGDKVPYQVEATQKDFDSITGTSVYVLKDTEGNVLYVGEGDVWERLPEHIKDVKKTPWFGEISRLEVRATALTKKESLALEEDLIDQLKPKYNQVLRPFEEAYPGQLRGPDLPKSQQSLMFDVELGT